MMLISKIENELKTEDKKKMIQALTTMFKQINIIMEHYNDNNIVPCGLKFFFSCASNFPRPAEETNRVKKKLVNF